MSESPKTQLGVRDIVDIEAWVNPRFKDDLQRDPRAAMSLLGEKYGFDVPADVEFRVVLDAPGICHIVVPANPAGEAPAEDDSEVMAYVQRHTGAQLGGGTVMAAVTTGSIFGDWACNAAICSAVNPSLCSIAAPGGGER